MRLRRFVIFSPLVGAIAACLDARLEAEQRAPLPFVSAMGSDDAASVEGSTVGRCTPGAPFGAPQRVKELSDPIRNEWVFRVATDERSALLSRQDNEASRIFTFTRSDRDRPWSVVGEVTGPWGAFVGDPSIALIDGKRRLLHTEQIAGLSSIRMADWDSEKSVVVGADEAVFTSTFNDVSPLFLEISNELWFMRDPATGSFRLHRSVRRGSAFDAPEIDPVLGGATFEANGAVAFSPDGLTVFFGARTSGSATDVDVYSAKRAAIGAPFENIAIVEAVSSAAFDQPISLSSDGCVLYLTSARGEGDATPGSIDVFVAKRER